MRATYFLPALAHAALTTALALAQSSSSDPTALPQCAQTAFLAALPGIRLLSLRCPMHLLGARVPSGHPVRRAEQLRRRRPGRRCRFCAGLLRYFRRLPGRIRIRG